MKKTFAIFLLAIICFMFAGFTNNEETVYKKQYVFNIDDLYDYQKTYKSEEITSCASNSTKTYMDYRATTVRDSTQYRFIHEQLTVDDVTGFLYDKDGFIGVALGSYYGKIGDRYYFTLDSGVVLPLVKCEEKSNMDTDPTGCYHTSDNSVIEFVIDMKKALDYFGRLSNSYVLNGNYNNYALFRGNIVKVEKVLEEKNEHYVTFSNKEKQVINPYDYFNYASGY